jgi:hypothetical protein
MQVGDFPEGLYPQSTLFLKYHSVCPFVGNWGLHTPSPASEFVPPPLNQRGGGGHTRLRMRGWWSPNFQRLESKLSTLSTLRLYKFTTQSVDWDGGWEGGGVS